MSLQSAPQEDYWENFFLFQETGHRADTLSSIETRSVCPCKSDLPLTSFPHFSFSSIPEGTLGRDGLPLSCGPGN